MPPTKGCCLPDSVGSLAGQADRAGLPQGPGNEEAALGSGGTVQTGLEGNQMTGGISLAVTDGSSKARRLPERCLYELLFSRRVGRTKRKGGKQAKAGESQLPSWHRTRGIRHSEVRSCLHFRLNLKPIISLQIKLPIVQVLSLWPHHEFIR